MEFCFYCSRFPTPGQAYLSFAERYGQRTFLRALERRLNAALAGEVGARPRRGGTPGNSRPGSWSPVGTVQDRPRRQPKRRLNAALVGEVGARPRRGIAPRAIRACGPGPRWGPFRTDRGGSRDGGLRRACGRGRRTSAPWVSGAPAAWNFAFPSLKLHKTGVNCRKSMVPGWKTLAKQAILRYYGKVNGAGGLPRRPPG